MASVKFYTRKKTGDKPVSVYVRFSDGAGFIQRERTRLTVVPDHWNAGKQRVKNVVDATYKDNVNQKLNQLYSHIKNEHIKACGEAGRTFLSDAIEEYYNPGGMKGMPKTLFEFIQHFIETAPRRLNPKTGRPVSYKMQREYHRTFEYLKEFAGKKKLDFDDIDLDFYNNFVEFLKNKVVAVSKDGEVKKHMAMNTIGKKVQTLKIFLNAATETGINKSLRYKSKNFVSPKEDTEHIYLNTKELSAIEAVELPTKELDQIRDLFLIGAWTGLRFSDWNQVNDNIKDGMLHIKQQKTRHKIIIPLHSTVQNIVEKHNGDLPKVPTNQHMNRTIKEIAKMAGINEPVQTSITRGGMEITTKHEKWELISTHTARRSFATNMYLMNVPSLTIMAITGHKTESAFLRYIKVTPKEHALKLAKLWQKETKVVSLTG